LAWPALQPADISGHSAHLALAGAAVVPVAPRVHASDRMSAPPRSTPAMDVAPRRPDARPRAFALLLAATATLSAGRAEAAGRYFLLELAPGLSEPAYADGVPGARFGLVTGATWKLVRAPFRFHLLTGLTTRSGGLEASYHGVPLRAERRDLDLYVAHRLAVPIGGPVRLFGELGVGHRWIWQRVERGAGLGDLSGSGSELFVMVAAGASVRISDRFSAGLRWELSPATADADLVEAASGVERTPLRMGLAATFGVHL
jgi:opacity protein-like surface antigen